MSDASTQVSNRIFYCERCGMRIPPTDFQNQRASFVNESEAICATCLQQSEPIAVQAQRPKSGAQDLPTLPSQTASPAPVTNVANVPKVSRRNTATHGRGSSHAGPVAGLPWKSALAGAVVFGALVGAFALSRSKKSESAAETKTNPKREIVERKPGEKKPETMRFTPPVVAVVNPPRETVSPALDVKAVVKPVAPPVDDYDPRKAVSESLLAQAKDYQRKNAEDVFGYRDKLQWLIDRYRGTAAGDEATKLIAEIKLPAFDPELHPEPTADAAWAKAASVLSVVDPQKDALAGSWSLNNGNVRSDKSMWAKIGVPYVLPEEYDLRLTFTRHDNDCLLIVLARHGKPFIFSIGSGNANASFEEIREKRKDVVATKMSPRPGLISNGARQQIVVQVRRGCLRGYLNGKLLAGCQVDDDGLSLDAQLHMPQAGQLGLLTWDSVFDFHAIEVLPLKGEGKFLR